MKKITIVLLLFLIGGISCKSNSRKGFYDSPTGIDCYYGIGVTVNYEKAFERFQKEGEEGYPFLIMMYLNGDGVGQSDQKAQEILDKARETPNGGNQTYSALEKILKNRKVSRAKKNEKVNFEDFAMTTDDSAMVLYIQKKLGEQQVENELVLIKNNLNREAKVQLEIIENQLELMKENDGLRVELGIISGSGMSLSKVNMEGYLARRHQQRVETWLVKRKLEILTAKDFTEEDKALNDMYKKGIDDYEKYYKDEIHFRNPSGHGEAIKNINSERDEFNKYLMNSQRAWIKYRDAWAALLKLYKPIGLNDEQVIEKSVKTLLTIDRTEELKESFEN